MSVRKVFDEIKVKELTEQERKLAFSVGTLEERQQKFPELSAKVSAIWQRAIQIAEEREQAAQPESTPEDPMGEAQQLTERAAAHIAKMEALIKQLENTPTQESVAASDVAEKLARIEAILAKNGVTLEDLENGVVEVRLIGSRLIADVATTLGDRDQRGIEPDQLTGVEYSSNNIPYQPETEWTADHARGLLLKNLFNKNLLTDEMISHQEGEIILSKPFSQWPKELQDKLRPFGAEMIE
jgi:hypothetical protein